MSQTVTEHLCSVTQNRNMSVRSQDPPAEDVELGARVNAMARAAGSRIRAAEIAGITVQQLGRIVSGRSANPSAAMLARLAQATGYDLNWVLTGEGPVRREQGPPSAPPQGIDRRFFGRVGDAIMKAHRSQGVELPVSELCQLAAEEYERLAGLEFDEDGQIAVAKGLQAKWEKRLASESPAARKVGA